MIKARHSKYLSLVTFGDISSVNKYKDQGHNDHSPSDATQNNKEDRNKCILTGNQPASSCSMVHGPHIYTFFG